MIARGHSQERFGTIKMRPVRLLVVQSDERTGTFLADRLRSVGYDVLVASDGLEARQLFAMERIDLSILDVALPKKDGLRLAREMREQDPAAPFVFLTACGTMSSKKEGFRVGADDYITKPFEFDELLMRINAILERTQGPRLHRAGTIRFGCFSLDPRSRSLQNGDHLIELTEKELRLLHLLVNHVGEVVTRTELLEHAWGKDDPYHSKSMDVYLTRIRKYLRADPGVVLHNIHGRGYRLEVKVQR